MEKTIDPWTKRSVIDPTSGLVTYRYFYKRKPAFKVEIKSPKAKTLAGYALIEKDLRSAIFWLNGITEIMKDDKKWTESNAHGFSALSRDQLNLVKGLFVAALTFYGKAFSQCKGRKIKLERANLSAEFQDDHELAMAYRHNFAAHSGAENLEQAQIFIGLDKKKKALPIFSIDLSQPDTLVLDGIYGLQNLFEHAKKFVDEKIELLTRLVKEEIAEKGSDYWYKKATSSKSIHAIKGKW